VTLVEEGWVDQDPQSTQYEPILMTRLRRKLGEPQIIQTIGGEGYRAVPPFELKAW
jgi:DNA-binding response OmpR family regulator